MKIITVEEHYTVPEVDAYCAQAKAARSGNTPPQTPAHADAGVLGELGEKRLAAMDRSGITAQIIGYGGNSPMHLRKEENAVTYCRMANDYLAQAVRQHPGRMYGYAVLPVDDPAAAAAELERCVRELGLVGWMIDGPADGEFLDHERFLPIFAKAAELDVPIYIHPGHPSAEVTERYYTGSWNALTASNFSTFSIGWHYDTGMHLMRLILSGIFDKLPDLKIIVGHWGETLPYFLRRMGGGLRPQITGLQHDMKYYFWNNVYTNPSGMFFEEDFDLCLKVLNPDHILWGQDYPFVPNTENAGSFLEQYPIDAELKEKIAHGNVERIFHLA